MQSVYRHLAIKLYCIVFVFKLKVSEFTRDLASSWCSHITTSVGHKIFWSKLSRFKQEYFSLFNPIWHRLTHAQASSLRLYTQKRKYLHCEEFLQSQSQRICPSQRGVRLKMHISLMPGSFLKLQRIKPNKRTDFLCTAAITNLIRLRLCTIALRYY